MVIRAVVSADTKDEALDKARDVFEGLCRNSYPFDYYAIFEEYHSPVSGKARWGNIPPIVRADSKKGKELIQEGFEATRKEFMEHIQDLRRRLELFSDEELFEEKDIGEKIENEKLFPGFFKYRAYMAGNHSGSSVWLYDSDGEGLRTSEELHRALKGENGQKVWVVPADVHF